MDSADGEVGEDEVKEGVEEEEMVDVEKGATGELRLVTRFCFTVVLDPGSF